MILLDSDCVSRWQAGVLEEIASSGIADACLGVVSEAPWVPRAGFGDMAFRAWWRFFGPGDTSVPITSLPGFEELPLVHCRPEKVQGHREDLPSDVMNRVQSLSPDLILRFGFGVLAGDVLSAAPLGVWSYHHGDNRHYRGRPAALWEMFEGEPRVGGILQVLSDELDGGRVLDRWTVPCHPWSYRANLHAVQAAGRWAVRQALQRVVLGGDPVNPALAFESEPAGPPALRRAPRNGEMALFLARVGWRRCREVLRKLFFEEVWEIKASWSDDGVRPSPRDVETILSAPQGEFVADPCVVETADGVGRVLMYERYDHARGVGWVEGQMLPRGPGADLRGLGIQDSGRLTAQDLHRSYPQPIVDDEGRPTHRIVVESKMRGPGVEVYALKRSGEGPPMLDLASRIPIDVPVADPNVFVWGGYWWLLATDPEGHLNAWFSSRADFDDVTPHPFNPVVVDARWARGGGAVFVDDGRLMRVSQDGSPGYGSAIWLLEVVDLSPETFVQKPVWRCGPEDVSQRGDGLHTLARLHPRSVIWDLRRWRFRPTATMRRALASRLGRALSIPRRA